MAEPYVNESVLDVLVDLLVTSDATPDSAAPRVLAAALRESGLRAQLAGRAMQALLAGEFDGSQDFVIQTAKFSVRMADALLAELAKGAGNG